MFQFLLEQLPNIILTILGISVVRLFIRSRWPKIKERYFDGFIFLVFIIGFVINWAADNKKSQEAAEQKRTINAMREYSVVARLNPSGLTGIAGPGLKEEPDSRLAGLEETWIRHEDRRTLQCNSNSR